MRNFHRPGRSVAMGCNGAAATSHQQATLTAAEVLRDGGSAVDAAVAAAALLGVIEPNSTGIGGDSFALLWQADEGKLYGINGSGYAPEGLSTEWLLGSGTSTGSTRTASTASSSRAPCAAGRRCWPGSAGAASSGMLAPAIAAADEGFPVAERDRPRLGALRRPPEPARGKPRRPAAPRRPPAPGTVLRFPKLAETLRRVAEGGADAFYAGEIATAMVATLTDLGGRHSVEDFAAWQPQLVTPITTRYRGVDVHQIPPNGQGIMVSMMLNVLEGFDHAAMDPLGADRFHLQIEAYRLAVAARNEFIADPDHAEVPVAELISSRYADALRARIDPRRAMPDPVVEPVGPDRHRLPDDSGRRGKHVLLHQSSISAAFGSAILCPRTGVLFQNRGSGFVVRPGHRNTVAPAQAVAAHDHSGLRHSRRRAMALLRGHARLLPAARPGAGPAEHRRFRHERAGGNRRAARPA